MKHVYGKPANSQDTNLGNEFSFLDLGVLPELCLSNDSNLLKSYLFNSNKGK